MSSFDLCYLLLCLTMNLTRELWLRKQLAINHLIAIIVKKLNTSCLNNKKTTIIIKINIHDGTEHLEATIIFWNNVFFYNWIICCMEARTQTLGSNLRVGFISSIKWRVLSQICLVLCFGSSTRLLFVRSRIHKKAFVETWKSWKSPHLGPWSPIIC